MNTRGLGMRGRHCNCGVLALVLASLLPVAWGQTPTPTSSAKPPLAAGKVAATTKQPVHPPLKLYVGHASELLSGTQWEHMMAVQPPETTVNEPEPQTIEVKGERHAEDVPGGIGSLFWAVRHPSDAWRIFAPVPPR